jgi:hypothetical protein
MTDRNNLNSVGERAAFPDDLRLWLDEGRLVQLVLQAVAGLDRVSPPGPATVSGMEPGPRALPLALLTYAYVTGRLASDEIETCADGDSVLSSLCAGNPVNAARLRSLRRRHRGPLSVAVFRVLWMAARTRLSELGISAHHAEEAELLRNCAEKAEVLLDRAVLADTVALDV